MVCYFKRICGINQAEDRVTWPDLLHRHTIALASFREWSVVSARLRIRVQPRNPCRARNSASAWTCLLGCFRARRLHFVFDFPCIWFAVPVGPVYHFLIRLSILAWHLLLFVVWSRALLVRWYRYFAVVVLAVPARLLSRRMWPSACRRGWCLWPTYILIQSLCLLMALASVARTPQATHWSQGCCPRR